MDGWKEDDRDIWLAQKELEQYIYGVELGRRTPCAGSNLRVGVEQGLRVSRVRQELIHACFRTKKKKT